jgi:hypothetical protein
LKPGGRLFVIDTDDGALVVSPPPDGFTELMQARHASLRRRGSDPLFARRLVELLTGAGFTDIAGRSLNVSSLELGAAAFAGIILRPFAEAVDADLMPVARVQQAQRAIEAWAERSDVFGMTTAVIAAARRGEEAGI